MTEIAVLPRPEPNKPDSVDIVAGLGDNAYIDLYLEKGKIVIMSKIHAVESNNSDGSRFSREGRYNFNKGLGELVSQYREECIYMGIDFRYKRYSEGGFHYHYFEHEFKYYDSVKKLLEEMQNEA